MKTYTINKTEFTIEELTLGEMEDIISLLGQLEINIKPLSKQNEFEEPASFENIKKIKDAFSVGDLINGLIKAIGAVGSAGLIHQMFSIILTRKDNGNKETAVFFRNTKRTQALEVLKDFLSGEGQQIVTGIISLVNLNKEKSK